MNNDFFSLWLNWFILKTYSLQRNNLIVLVSLSSNAHHPQRSLQSRHIGTKSHAALHPSSSQVLAHHGIMGRHNNSATCRGGGDALLPPPLSLWCWSRRSDPTTPSTYTTPNATSSPLRCRTPEEGVGGPVVLAGVAEQASAGGWQANGVDVVLQDAVLHVGNGVVAQWLLQEQTNQRGLEGLVAKLAQGLQDASDPQVVVLRPLENKAGGHNVISPTSAAKSGATMNPVHGKPNIHDVQHVVKVH